MNRKSNAAGICLVAVSSILYGIIPLFVKLVLKRGMSVSCGLAYRLFIISAMAFYLVRRRGYSFRISRRQAAELLIFGLTGFGLTNTLLGTSYYYIDMGLATVCHFVYPVVVVVIMRLLFGERLNQSRAGAVILTLSGLALLARGSGAGSLNGVLLAMLSGGAYGVYIIALDKASICKIEKTVIVCYVTAECAVVYLIQSLCSCTMRLPENLSEWWYLAAAAMMSMAAMLLLTQGVRLMGAANASFINMLEPLTSLAIDFLYYGTVPGRWQSLGSLLILAAVGFICAGNITGKKKGLF